MHPRTAASTLRLPSGWNRRVKSAVLHVVSLAQLSLTYARGWAANSINARVRLAAENDRLRQEVALLGEEVRIKDARMGQIAPHRRPQYPPTGRMAILELRAARGWSLVQTAKAFLVTPATIASWNRCLDEEGPDALVRLPVPVNKFPDFVRHAVQRLKVLCPTMGKLKMAETLTRAGLHLGATTVGRMLKRKPVPFPKPEAEPKVEGRVVTAKRPNHVWHVDLTEVPTMLGFWCAWLPFALPQSWPFCWWLAIAVDHYSRRAAGFSAFKGQPTSEAVRAFLGRTTARTGAGPKHLICDKGRQFWCEGFKEWCRRRGVKPRFGAVGKQGSIAVVERLILSLKTTLRCLTLVPLRVEAFHREVALAIDWYNEHRPHSTLGGRTPSEVYFNRYPANRKPRFEPRSRWPRGSPCAAPWALVKGRPGTRVELQVGFLEGRKHLPVVRLVRAA